MEKYILECPTCKATSSTKNKHDDKDKTPCYYCGTIMIVIYHADSSAPTLWGFVCEEPSQNLDKLKPEFMERFKK